LHQRVAARVKIDPLPWDDEDGKAPVNYTQASLF